jgi:hypothetical protein
MLTLQIIFFVVVWKSKMGATARLTVLI